MADIFFSFVATDKERIRPLAEALVARGWSVFWDTSIKPGESWSEVIEREFEQARCVVVVWTTASVNSQWVLRDAHQGMAREILIPLVLDAVDIPFDFRGINSVDLTDWQTHVDRTGLRDLIQVIEAKIGPPAKAGDAPAAPRPGRDFTRRIRIPDIAWVEIPAGRFVYQAGETRELPTFWIAKYPITNIQFQCFSDDMGYTDARWWSGLKKPEPAPSTWRQSNRPRTDVDWHEAVAFTRWLAFRLGVEVRLPTEAEWEKAARGEHGLAYPWGEKYQPGFANIDETWDSIGPWHLGQTTAVGLYPQGRSPYAVHDLSGTVWEWCLNEYENPDVNEFVPSDVPRALRGGSWFNLADVARAVLRLRNHPVVRLNRCGFRVVSSVPM